MEIDITILPWIVAGAFFSWMRHDAGYLGTKKLREIVLRKWLKMSDNGVSFGECLFVVIFGTMIASLYIDPQTPEQAFAAGVAWPRITELKG